jgi:trehalose-6-phosphate synthase
LFTTFSSISLVIANPYDADAVAEALQTALGTPFEERCTMMAVLRRNSIMAWRESFLGLSAALARDVVERDIGAAKACQV